VSDRVAVEVAVAAPREMVWRALRDPVEIRRWFGWDYDGLDAEIEGIFLSEAARASASEAEGVLDTGGGRFELAADGEATLVRVVMPDGGDEAVVEGWITFVQQLRFALERHHGQDRDTLYLRADPPDALGLDALAGLGAGERYTATVATGDELEGAVWFRSEHQLGLTVDAWGDGLLVVGAPPSGGSAVLTTYGLDARELEALRERWTASWRPAAG
jgi:uncharacterized protein YndB with AHSA1/START domain